MANILVAFLIKLPSSVSVYTWCDSPTLLILSGPRSQSPPSALPLSHHQIENLLSNASQTRQSNEPLPFPLFTMPDTFPKNIICPLDVSVS